jgi:hypothetical protein
VRVMNDYVPEPLKSVDKIPLEIAERFSRDFGVSSNQSHSEGSPRDS